jgi:hypothetical protein
MSLVNELQVSAETEDVLTVLRKAKRLASKLERDDIAEWLESEQSGYENPQAVPDYRRINSVFAFNTNGLVPAGFGQLMHGVQDLPTCGVECAFPVMAGISTVQGWMSHGANAVYFPIEANSEQTRLLREAYGFDPRYARQFTFMIHLNKSEIMAIPERIKDKVLDWALALERAKITGEGMSFSDKEKQLAQTVTLNIIGSTIEQLSNTGTNKRAGT